MSFIKNRRRFLTHIYKYATGCGVVFFARGLQNRIDGQTHDFLCDVKVATSQVGLEIDQLLSKAGAKQIKEISQLFARQGRLFSFRVLDLEDRKVWHYQFSDYTSFKQWESEILEASYFNASFFTNKGTCQFYYGADASKIAARIFV
jgi:hypothetical protein